MAPSSRALTRGAVSSVGFRWAGGCRFAVLRPACDRAEQKGFVHGRPRRPWHAICTPVQATWTGDRILEAGVNVQRDFLSLMVMTAASASAAMGQRATPIPEMSGSWNHASLNGLELPLTGPGPVRNSSRLREGPQASVGNGAQLVGDYTSRTRPV